MTTSWIDGELLAFDLETTGIDKFEDVPVSFALVWFDERAIVRTRAELVHPGREIPDGAAAVHGISTERAMAEGISMVDAVDEIGAALLDASRRGVPVVGFNLQYDLTMIDARMRALGQSGLLASGWTGPVLDPMIIERTLYSRFERSRLVDVCERYGVVNEAAHDASGDAIASVRVLESQTSKFTQLLMTDLHRMTQVQVEWHQEWAQGFHEYRLRKFGEGLKDDEFDWPIAGQQLLES